MLLFIVKRKFDKNQAKLGIKTLDWNVPANHISRFVVEFVEEVFENGQEMLILVTEMTVRYYCAKFITKFGCDEYFKHNQDLLFYERKQELLAEISDLDL